jgi:hypothetical protein
LLDANLVITWAKVPIQLVSALGTVLGFGRSSWVGVVPKIKGGL